MTVTIAIVVATIILAILGYFRRQWFITIWRSYSRESVLAVFLLTGAAIVFLGGCWYNNHFKHQSPIVEQKIVYVNSTATNIFAVATVVLDDAGVQHLDLKKFTCNTSDEALANMLLENARTYRSGNKLQMNVLIQINN